MIPLALSASPVATTPAAAPPMAVLLAQAPLLSLGDCHPVPLTIEFDGTLAHFLAQVWHFMECYGAAYPDDATHIDCVTLDGDVAEWLVALDDDDTPELLQCLHAGPTETVCRSLRIQ